MLKCLREKHPYLYCALAVVLFMAAMMAGQFLFSVAVVLLGPAGLTQLVDSEPYLLQAVSELFALLAPLFLLWRTGAFRVFTRRGTGFLDGMLVGIFPFVQLCLALSLNVGIVGPPEGAVPKAVWRVVVFQIGRAHV